MSNENHIQHLFSLFNAKLDVNSTNLLHILKTRRENIESAIANAKLGTQLENRYFDQLIKANEDIFTNLAEHHVQAINHGNPSPTLTFDAVKQELEKITLYYNEIGQTGKAREMEATTLTNIKDRPVLEQKAAIAETIKHLQGADFTSLKETNEAFAKLDEQIDELQALSGKKFNREHYAKLTAGAEDVAYEKCAKKTI